MRWRRKIVLLAILAAVALAVAYGFMPRPVAVDALEVRRGPMSVTLEEEGKTRVIDRFVVSAPVAGFARRIELNAGDPVKRGQVLVALEPLRAEVLDPRKRAEAEARVKAAEAALKEAEEEMAASRASADYAEAELRRIQGLHEKGYVSMGEFEQAETDARLAGARLRSLGFAVDVARFELEAARTALLYSAAEGTGGLKRRVAISSPVHGRVLKVQHESEGVVAAGEALIEIGDPRALEVEVEVLSDDAVRIGPGTRVLLERWGGAGPLEGRVRAVEPAGFTKVSALGVEEQRVLVISDIVSPPERWERLGDGYRVEARFILWEGEDVLQAPSSALFRHEEGWAVFVMKNGRALRRQVETGRRSGLSAEVLSGLSEGEMVIPHPDRSIEDRTRVKLRERG
jgi:HlyD family secretion protein